MPKLPNADTAIIPRDKLVGYLLSTSHPVGRTKAAYFGALGFDESRPEEFESALREHVARSHVMEQETNEFGDKYVVEGKMDGPRGSASRVRTVWIILKSEDKPRLVTAYPG